MARTTDGTLAASLALLGAAALGGCGDGADPARATAELRAKVEAQAAEVESLRKGLREMEARSRVLEERLAATRPPAGTAAAPAPAGRPGSPEGKGPVAAPPAAEGPLPPSAEAVAAYLDTDQGRLKIREAMQAEERRREEQTRQERREQALSLIKERVAGPLTEQLGLDSNQQQTVITVAADTMEKMEEIWRGARDARGDPNFFQQAREKTTEVRQQALDKLQQALTVDQYNKLQEIMNEGGGGAGMLLGGRGMGGGFGGPGGGPPAGGGAGQGGRTPR